MKVLSAPLQDLLLISVPQVLHKFPIIMTLKLVEQSRDGIEILYIPRGNRDEANAISKRSPGMKLAEP